MTGFINPSAGGLLVANNLSEIAAAGASAQASARTNLGLGTTGTMQLDYLGLGVARTAGRLQLVSGTTAADGIYFGADTIMYRSGVGALTLSGMLEVSRSGSSTIANFTNSADTDFQVVIAAGSSVTIGPSTNTALILKSGGATSATLDTSQRLILAGALRLNNAHVAGAPAATGYVTVQDSAGNTMKLLCSNV